MINRKRLIRTFTELVKIDSPSGEEKAISDFLAKKLASLGGKVEKDSYGNLVGQFNGRGKPILLCAHMDTVEPGRGIKPKVSENKITSGGTTILGGDDKAGVTEILETLEAAKENNIAIRPIDIVFTREEETSLGGAKNLNYSLLRAQEGLVLDGDEEVSKIFISSPTYYNLDTDITGKSAHAGVEPEKGISAIKIAGEIISQLPLGRIDFETTFNIGMIEGGSVRNAVPEKASFHGEIRSRNLKTLEKIIGQTKQLFEKISKLYPGATIDLRLEKEFDGFVVDKKNPLIIKASRILSDMNLKAELKDSGGGTDANIFGTNGIETVIVGIGVREGHTTREYVVIDEMINTVRFCLEFIKA